MYILHRLHLHATNIKGPGDSHIDESVYQYAYQHGQPEDGVSGDDGGTGSTNIKL